ncbi:MAG: ABC transporter permease subunit [Planctomycetota bacterium]|nr:ABC transporter permease subunit [Planctomycetota bacterium]
MNFLLIMLVIVAGILFTQRGIPLLVRLLLRLFGIRIKTSPLAKKRIRRFKSIRRGYISFVIVTSCFTTSLFLEVLVNDKPIMIRYEQERAFPAVRDLANTWLFFVEGPFATFDRSGDFGIPGDGPLDYAAFGEIVADPTASFGPIAGARREDANGLEAEIRETQLEIAAALENGDEPEEWLIEDLEAANEDLVRLLQQIEGLGAIESVFTSGGASVIWPLYRHGPKKNRLGLPGTAPHGPSLPIPGITPANLTATLLSRNQESLGGQPTYTVAASGGQRLGAGMKYFVVEGGGTGPITDVLGILLIREVSDATELNSRIRSVQQQISELVASGDPTDASLTLALNALQEDLASLIDQVGEDGSIGTAEVLSKAEGKSFPENARLVTRFLDTWEAPLGTSDSGIDVLPLLLYGFRVSVGFAILVMGIGYIVGIFAGAVMGYYGGWTDILLQRFIEIWGSVPFLFLIMIIASIIDPGFWMLVIFLVVLRSWMAVTYQIRGEFYREKAKDYVQAAIGSGVSDFTVMIRHILPNSMIPVISRAPFSFVNYINALVSLDFLGFGLPPTDPSWGRLLSQGFQFLLIYPHLVLLPVLALAVTLFLVVLIGEAVREAFDPKVFSRLR